MSDTVISVEHLSKKYQIGGAQKHHTLRDQMDDFIHHPFGIGKENQESQEFWALTDVSFDIKRGDVVGVIGRNGSGKSTLLKILSRIVEPTIGKVTMRGRVASLLEVGTGFNGDLTGRENVYLNGAILGMDQKEISQKFDEIVAFSGVKQFIDTPVKRYSSGMYVRLAFAVAAHLDSDILLVDEVLAVGDSEFQKKCLGKMQNLAAGGRTVLFVSHSMSSIQSLCDTCLWFKSGKLLEFDTTKKIVDLYVEDMGRDSKNLIGNPEHLCLDQVVMVDDNDKIIKSIPFLQKIQLRIVFHLLSTDESMFRLGVNFNTTNGQRIFTIHHTIDPHDIPKDSHVSIIMVDNFLLPGTYQIDVGAHSVDGNWWFAEENSLFITVNEDARAKKYNPGIIHVSSQLK